MQKYWRKVEIIVLQFNKVSMKYFYSFSITDLIKLMLLIQETIEKTKTLHMVTAQ